VELVLGEGSEKTLFPWNKTVGGVGGKVPESKHRLYMVILNIIVYP
jgi:hypothetical protein